MIAQYEAVWMVAGAIAGGGLAAALGRSPVGVLVVAAAVAALALAAAIDIRERRVPNVMSYGVTAAGLLAAAVTGHAVAALLGLTLALLVMGALYLAGRGRLGLGDVKIAVAVGTLLGPAGIPIFLLASSIAGTLGAVWLLARGYDRHATMPYAPALAVGAVIALFTSGPLLG